MDFARVTKHVLRRNRNQSGNRFQRISNQFLMHLVLSLCMKITVRVMGFFAGQNSRV